MQQSHLLDSGPLARSPAKLSITMRTHFHVAAPSSRTVRFARALTADSSYAVEGLAFSTTPVDIFPSRITSSADTVTISTGRYARRIILTTSGEVRILP